MPWLALNAFEPVGDATHIVGMSHRAQLRRQHRRVTTHLMDLVEMFACSVDVAHLRRLQEPVEKNIGQDRGDTDQRVEGNVTDRRRLGLSLCEFERRAEHLVQAPIDPFASKRLVDEVVETFVEESVALVGKG